MSSRRLRPDRTKKPDLARNGANPGAPGMEDGFDSALKRRVVFELPHEPPVSDDEAELFSRLFGDIVDQILNPEDRQP
jgi:hypothetical protein